MSLQPIATIIASALVVIVTGYFAWHQKNIAENKLRLDLYNRRFDIFLSIFQFYEAMIAWTGTAEQKEARTRFFRAYQESGFLFDKSSGIEDLLKALNDAGAKVIGFKENVQHYRLIRNFLSSSIKRQTTYRCESSTKDFKNSKVPSTRISIFRKSCSHER